MSNKDVYILRLCFHAGCDFQVNIPNLFDFPTHHKAL